MEADVKLALEEINNGKSVNAAAKALSSEVESELAECIGVLCNVGFSPTMAEIIDLVAEYLKKNNLTISAFKQNRPGYDWLKAFMKRNSLSLKKANMICTARKSATANPFLIYGFFDLLEQTITDLNLDAHQIWNCDESGFQTDPHRSKVVSVKGQTAFKMTSGARRENITTLAVCSAS